MNQTVLLYIFLSLFSSIVHCMESEDHKQPLIAFNGDNVSITANSTDEFSCLGIFNNMHLAAQLKTQFKDQLEKFSDQKSKKVNASIVHIDLSNMHLEHIDLAHIVQTICRSITKLAPQCSINLSQNLLKTVNLWALKQQYPDHIFTFNLSNNQLTSIPTHSIQDTVTLNNNPLSAHARYILHYLCIPRKYLGIEVGQHTILHVLYTLNALAVLPNSITGRQFQVDSLTDWVSLLPLGLTTSSLCYLHHQYMYPGTIHSNAWMSFDVLCVRLIDPLFTLWLYCPSLSIMNRRSGKDVFTSQNAKIAANLYVRQPSHYTLAALRCCPDLLKELRKN